MSQNDFDFYALGKVVKEPVRKLDVFPKPAGVQTIVMESDEVTSLCPITGQPDWETVIIEYEPDQLCIESKSLKLYFWSFRQEGVFCEALAAQIANDIGAACKPHSCKVTVIQKPRGGITIRATAYYEPDKAADSLQES
ncbi:MAG: preQ(1) synthase [Dethiobacteraceae bacterium]|jgi:7-cyano-7-deazaguanine reductase|nr:preQ(1) synthase [Bacillota bacterium]